MVDTPSIDPQQFSKSGNAASVPTLSGQGNIPSLRGIRSVTPSGLAAQADAYASMADDASRLQNMAKDQFNRGVAEIQHRQALEAEKAFSTALISSDEAVTVTRNTSPSDKIVQNSLETFDKVMEDSLGGVELSRYQRDYINSKLPFARSAVGRQSVAYQSSIKAADARDDASDILNQKLFLASKNPGLLPELLAEADNLAELQNPNLSSNERRDISDVYKAQLATVSLLSKAKGSSQNVDDVMAEIDNGMYEDVLSFEQTQNIKSDLSRMKDSFAKQEEAELKQMRDIEDAKLGVSIATSPLQDLPTQVELDSRLESGQLSPSQWAKHSKALDKRFKDANKENEGILAISEKLQSGQGINPRDSGEKKSLDQLYKRMSDTFADASPQAIIAAKAELVTQARYIPDTMVGELINAGRSGNASEVLQAAELIDELSEKAPYATQAQLLSDPSIGRIYAIRDQLNAGFNIDRAIQTVDAREANVATTDIVNKRFKEKTKSLNMEKEVSSIFETGTFGFDILNLSKAQAIVGFQGEEFNQAVRAYEIALRTHYSNTNDIGVAKELAKKQIKSQFSQTSVNGPTVTMRYAPELVYGGGERGTDWLREQLISSSMERAKQVIPDFDSLDKEKLKDRIKLVPHPFITPETFNQGTPEYDVIIVDENDAPKYRLTDDRNMFSFDESKVMESIVKGQKARVGRGFENLTEFEQTPENITAPPRL